MKLDKEQKKELRNLIVAYAKKLGYKARQNTIFRVKDAAMVYCDFLVVDSKKLVYRVNIKNYDYDDIFWKIMQMTSNSKEPDSLRAVGAFQAPTITVKTGQITWKLLYRGLLEKQISINEIIEYAKEQLEKGDDRIEICELAGSSDYDLEDVMDTLYELAKEEKNPDDLEDRKLRAARVNKFLKDKNTNCIDGLMGLTELWLELGCTADSPHIIQGKDNSISPVEYYTDANYNYLYEKNKHWLKDEVYFLIHNGK